MSEPLSDDLRRTLESTVKKAREVAEEGARSALEALAVHRPEPFPHLGPDQRALRVQLRAHARQLGDPRDAKTGGHGISRLVAQTAYEHWHRMLFARFLAENELLMHPDGVAVTLDECEELAAEEGAADGWELACRYASRMLPQIFRPEAPELKVRLAPEHQRALEALVIGLDEAVFRASDSLGWVYQYWQARRKEEINASEVKIGADELPAVTQLFTEPYMVQFLLHNTLGAWWAGKVLAENLTLAANAADEGALRSACALPGYEWTFLRFIREEDGGAWRPAAGVFERWPNNASEITMLDPCCGSGHFLVEALQIIARLRIAEEDLGPAEAVDAALRDNIHGLEIDERCTQIAAFALAFAAWTFLGAGGFRHLPAMHVACSGLALASKKEEWLALAHEAASAGDMPVEKDLCRTQDSLMSSRLKADLSALYDLFKDAPTLGSLIDPRAMFGEMFQADFAALQGLLRAAMAAEHRSEETFERVVTANGLAHAAATLSHRYDLVATNVPYLGIGRYDDRLRDFIEEGYGDSKNDLAFAFVWRCRQFLNRGGSLAVVMTSGWTFQNRERHFRRWLLKEISWRVMVRLGAGAFREISGEVVQALLFVAEHSVRPQYFAALDVADCSPADRKEREVISRTLAPLNQQALLARKDTTVRFGGTASGVPLGEIASALRGLSTGEINRFHRYFWEPLLPSAKWDFIQTETTATTEAGGRSEVILWEGESGTIAALADQLKHLNHAIQSWRRGKPYWGEIGVAVNVAGDLHASLYSGEKYSANIGVLKPHHEDDLPALWAFCSSTEFREAVRSFNKKVSVEPRYFERVLIDMDFWREFALDMSFSSTPGTADPTLWVFHGHPGHSTKPLHVATARLLGYRWPTEFDPDIELPDEARASVAKAAELLPIADSDGIVCIPSVRSEEPGTARLQTLLAAAFGDQWSPSKLDQLLDQVGYRGKGLERWLRDAFFEQHCKLFHHRPFIWQIWDGLKDGFSALVNYHKLDRALLETLIYSYLGDWIRRQEDAERRGISGAEERLAAARALQERLVLILKGEEPYDIFVRWKPIEEQPIGWNPDLDDGVRLNIRPFMSVPDVGRKGAGVLRWKPNIHWKKDRGSDPEGMPWYHLGPEYGGKPGDRINDHHLSLDEKRRARLESGDKR
jgi:hypothetical protein